MTDRLRWGILGAGGIARTFATDLGRSRTGVLGAVASRNLAKAEALAAGHEGAVAFDSYQALVASEAVEAIYVATPTSLHAEHALLAIGAGKPVLCEKPFAGSVAEAEKVAKAAEEAGILVMEALWTRFLPVYDEIRQRLAAGAIGDLCEIHASLGFPRAENAGDPITDPALGGGALFDLGIYGVSMARWLAGPCALVAAQNRRSQSGSIRTAKLLLDAGGVAVSVFASHETRMENRLILSGTRGRISVDPPFIGGASARVANWQVPDPSAGGGGGGGKVSQLRQTPIWPVLKRAASMVRHPEGRRLGDYPGGLWFEADHIADCLAAGRRESEVMPVSQSVEIIALLEAAAAGS